jgi:ATP-dependent Clp protease ATP-binding subunit ClpA
MMGHKRRETSSLMSEDKLFGRENEKQMITDWLASSNTNISVFSLVGVGGVGKTALAQYFLAFKTVQKCGHLYRTLLM